MAFSQTARGARRADFGAYWSDVTDRVRRYRTYRQTLGELQSLSARELEDLGLNRSMIRSCAYKAAYHD